MVIKPPDIGDSTSQNVDSTTKHNQKQNMKVSQVHSFLEINQLGKNHIVAGQTHNMAVPIS